MRYGRSWAFWFGILFVPVIFAFALYIGYISLSWGPFFLSRSPLIGVTALAMGLIFICFPFYMVYSLFNRSVRCVDVESSVRITYLSGRLLAISRAQGISIRTGYRGMQELVITAEDGDHAINGPYMFRDYKGLFADLERWSGIKIRQG